MADQCSHSRALERIFASIVEDAVRRTAKGGRQSR
jgi:hypothetical protein